MSKPVSSLYQTVIQAISLSQKDIAWLDVSVERLELIPTIAEFSHNAIDTLSGTSMDVPTIPEAKRVAEAIRTCLSLTQNLTSLSLRAGYCAYELSSEREFLISNLFSAELSLPRLSHLELGDWIAAISDFAQFLTTHQLKSLIVDQSFAFEPCSQTEAAFISICHSILRIPSVQFNVICIFPDVVVDTVTTQRRMNSQLCRLDSLPWVMERVTVITPLDMSESESEFDFGLFDDPVTSRSKVSDRSIDLGDISITIPEWPNHPSRIDVSVVFMLQYR